MLVDSCHALIEEVTTSIRLTCPSELIAFQIRAELHLDMLRSLSSKRQQILINMLSSEISKKMKKSTLTSEDIEAFVASIDINDCMELLRMKLENRLPVEVMNPAIRQKLVGFGKLVTKDSP